jgi:peptidyl-prolyl cis-trans isomerase SurA
MRQYFIIFTYFLVFSIAKAQTPSQKLIDKIIARVGGEYILLSDVEEEFSYAKKATPTLTDSEKCQILDGLIGQKLVIHQAKLDSVEVSDDQIASELDTRFEKILAQMNGDEEFFKEYYGATIADMKERYREDQKQQMLARQMQQTLIGKVRITPAEVLEFYNGIPRDSLPYLGAEVELAELVLKPTVSRENRQKALNLIEELHKRIKEGGENFDDLAKKYSQDPESAKRGGDLGFARRGTFVPEFESAAFSLKKDEISDVIETDFGFHFLKLEERRGNLIRVKHILISPSITKDDETLAKQKLDTIRSMILRDSIDFLTAVRRHGDKNTPSFHNGGKLRNPNSGNSYFEIKDLDYDSYFAIEGLEINGISSVLDLEGQRGDKMFRILQLQSKSKPHRVSLETDYDKIANLAKESKKATYFNDWMKSIRSNVNIQVDRLFDGCPNLQDYRKNIKP